MTRDEKIEVLVRSDMDYIKSSDDGAELLHAYLTDGFVGYATFSDDELNMEIHQRSLMNVKS